jgi:hypothetical protein
MIETSDGKRMANSTRCARRACSGANVIAGTIHVEVHHGAVKLVGCVNDDAIKKRGRARLGRVAAASLAKYHCKSMMVHHDIEPLMRRAVQTRMRESQTHLYVTSLSIARAHTRVSTYRKERAFEHFERSEALAQVSPLAHHRGDDPRFDRYLSPLNSSRSRGALRGCDNLAHVQRHRALACDVE